MGGENRNHTPPTRLRYRYALLSEHFPENVL